MANPAGKLVMGVFSLAVGIPAGRLAQKGIERAWLAYRPDDPPRKPGDPDVRWSDALGYAALAAVGAATVELVRAKGAAELWRTIIGTEPPGKKAPENTAPDKKNAKK